MKNIRKKNHKTPLEHRDIRKIDSSELPDCDRIIGELSYIKTILALTW